MKNIIPFSKKQRECPALGHSIASADCGGNRGSRYKCPAACPFNPWSPENYGMALEIDTNVIEKVTRRIACEHRSNGEPLTFRGGDDLETNEFFINEILHKPDAQGRTFFQRWEAEKFTGLNNDERFFFKAYSEIRSAAVEVLEFRGNDECVVRDRLDLHSPPMLIHDRSLSAGAVRFSSMLARTFPMPHYTRMHGAAVPIPEVGTLDAEEIIAAIAAHLGGPTGGEPMRNWLNSNMTRMLQAFSALNSEFRRIMIESSKVVETRTTYKLNCELEEIASLLEGHTDTIPTDPMDEDTAKGFYYSWDWLFPKDDDATLIKINSVGRPVLGTILLGDTKIQMATMQESRHIRLRIAFEKMSGKRVTFVDEKKTDHTHHLSSDNPNSCDMALVPPDLLRHAPRLEFTTRVLSQDEVQRAQGDAWSLMIEHYKNWMDMEIAALDGRTPRQAVADPVMRPRVASIVKNMIRKSDIRRKENGGNEDLAWIAKELGLEELGALETPPIPISDQHFPEHPLPTSTTTWKKYD